MVFHIGFVLCQIILFLRNIILWRSKTENVTILTNWTYSLVQYFAYNLALLIKTIEIKNEWMNIYF